MGCLLKLIVLPIWWTIRVVVFAVRVILRRTTLLRFLGYLFGILVAFVSPTALLGALVCRIGSAWCRTHARRSVRWPIRTTLYSASLLLLLGGVLLWQTSRWILTAWGGQLVLALLGGLVLRAAGRLDAWSYVGFLFAPRRVLGTWGAGLLLGPVVYLPVRLAAIGANVFEAYMSGAGRRNADDVDRRSLTLRAMGDQAAETLLAELLDAWGFVDEPISAPVPSAVPFAPAVEARPELVPAGAPARSTVHLTSLGVELGEQLVSEILQGVRAGRQGVFVSDPERLRTAIFIRGSTLGDFARRAGLAPSTLSRALAGQPVAPSSWRSLITTLRRT